MEVVITVSFVISLLSFLFLRRIRQPKVTTVGISHGVDKTKIAEIKKLPAVSVSVKIAITIIAIIATASAIAGIILPYFQHPPPPSLMTSPDPISLTLGTMHSGNSISKQITLSNAGGGTLEWNVSADQPWITVNPRSGAGLGTVNIDVNTAGLQPGNYSGVITVSSNGGIRSGSISFNLVPSSPSPPILSISNNSFEFENTSTGESEVKILEISNNGGGTLDWRARTDSSWIELYNANGSNNGSIFIIINTTDLSPGSHAGIITIDSNGGTGQVAIELNVPPPAPTQTSPVTPPPPLIPLTVTVASEPTSIEIDQTSVIKVTVTGTYDKPISGATVMLSVSAGKVSPAFGITDINGQFNSTFKGSAEGKATVSALVKKKGFIDGKGEGNLAIEIAPLLTPTVVPTTTKPPVPTQPYSASNLLLFLILFILFLIVIFFILKYVFFRTKGLKANSLTIPTKMYEGDSNIILLHLAEHDPLVSNGTPKAMFFVDKQGMRQPSGIEIPSGFSPKSIEIELLAVGFDVEGEKRQKHELFGTMIYQWNISPTRSKDLEIGLVFRAEDASGQIEPLGVITHNINVVKILGLTGRQIGTLTNIFGAFGGVLGIIVTLNQLGILNFK